MAPAWAFLATVVAATFGDVLCRLAGIPPH